MTRHLAMVIFPGFQILDAAGPIAAFEIAERFAPDAYAMDVIAPGGGDVPSSSGVTMGAAPLPQLDLSEADYDTLMVVGGDGARRDSLAEVVDWLKAAAPRVRRVTSVCSGSWLLAAAGLLDGKRATTHWSGADEFRRRYPRVRLEADRIYVRDGEVWTSAGITAGIDLALALIEDDRGGKVAKRTAQQLVVHQRRPGGQSQFSSLLDAGGTDGRFTDLMDWVRGRLAEPMGVERMAEQAAMSPRHFARAFVAETGLTPAKAVERLRLQAARERVEGTRDPIDRVAEIVGFGDPERMRRAFLRAFGQPPQALRRSARA